MIAEVAVGQPEHQPVRQRIQRLRGALLRHAGAAGTAGRGVGGHGQVGGAGEGGVGGVGPVDVESPVGQRGAGGAHRQLHVVRTGRRGGGAVHIGRQNAAIGAGCGEALLRGGGAGEHAGPVHGAAFSTEERGAGAVEHVVGDVVGVRPHRQLRVVREVGVLEGIAVVGAGRVRGLRDRHALVVRAGGRVDVGELGEYPAAGEGVVADDGVAVVGAFAEPAEAGEQRVGVRRAVLGGAGLGEHREAGVHDLHQLRRADRGVRVRWHATEAERPARPGEPGAQAVEIGTDGRRTCSCGVLHHRVLRVCARARQRSHCLTFLVTTHGRLGRHRAQRRRRVVMQLPNELRRMLRCGRRRGRCRGGCGCGGQRRRCERERKQEVSTHGGLPIAGWGKRGDAARSERTIGRTAWGEEPTFVGVRTADARSVPGLSWDNES